MKSKINAIKKTYLKDDKGSITGMLSVSIFIGLILFIIIFSAVIHLSFFKQLGIFRYFFAYLLIFLSMVGTYFSMRTYIHFRFKNGHYDPIFVREMLQRCLQKDVGRLNVKLENSQLTPLSIMNEMFQGKMQAIIKDDGRYMSDVQAKYENNTIKKLYDKDFHKFFQTSDQYDLTSLPIELRLLESAVGKKLKPIAKEVAQLNKYRKTLFTLMGDYMDIFPPTASRIQWIRKTYKYRVPDEAKIRRISFALDFLSYLERTKNNTVRPLLKERMETVASERIRLLKNAVTQYKKAWYNLSLAYETTISRLGMRMLPPPPNDPMK